MRIIYRISDTGYNKVKPDYITNENCLANAVNVIVFYILKRVMGQQHLT